MERAILVIVLIVAVVGVAGLFTNYDFSAGDAVGITGNVVKADCSSCFGHAPVCGKVNNKFITYQNACEAECANANIAANYPCEHIALV